MQVEKDQGTKTASQDQLMTSRMASAYRILLLSRVNRPLIVAQCDEQKPQCSHCQRHSAVCEYPDLRKTPSASERSTSATPGPSLSGTSRDQGELNLTDLQLLTHWTFTASLSFGYKVGDEVAWQKDITQMASRHPFLMHAILAISALSMARSVSVSESQHYLLAAAHHQSKTFPSYRQIINDVEQNMNEENSHAVIATASLISVYSLYSLGSPGLPDSIGQGRCTLNEVCEWLSLIRGARGIMLYRWDWTANGPMSFCLREGPTEIDLSYGPEDTHLASLDGVFASWEPSPETQSSEIEAYQATLMLLRETFAALAQRQPGVGPKVALLVWVEKFPQRYLELLGEQRPAALILLAHYCVMLQRCGARYWYAEGAAERIMSMVYHALEQKWRHWIAWPFEEIRANTSWEIAIDDDTASSAIQIPH